MSIMVKLVIIVIFCGVVGAGLIWLLNYLQSKFSSKPTLVEKLEILKDIVKASVVKTNQTFVNSLKEIGSFNEEDQEYAFENTLYNIKTIIERNGYKFLNELVDNNIYMTTLIEYYVNQYKTSYLEPVVNFASCLDTFKDENGEEVILEKGSIDEVNEIKKD